MSILTQKKYGVYSITFHTERGDMVYIGSTRRSFQERFQKHRAELRRKVHRNSIVQRHWDKYGTADFDIIEVCTNPETVLQREQFHMDKVDRNCLINMGPALPNPMAGRQHSDETKKKLSDFFTGRFVSAETREKLRLVKLGKPGAKHTEETRQKMSEARKGEKRTEESKARMRIAQKGKVVSSETREKLRQAILRLTKEARAEIVKRGWETRRKNKL